MSVTFGVSDVLAHRMCGPVRLIDYVVTEDSHT
jgi:hypothetical protein